MWWQTAVSIVAGMLAMYGALLTMLWRSARRGRDTVTMRDALRLLPDVARLIRGLAADKSLPRGVRLRLGMLLIYVVSPVDLVPDFIPVIGLVDDAVIVAFVLRSVVRRAGADALAHHWPGTPQGLEVIRQLTRVSDKA